MQPSDRVTERKKLPMNKNLARGSLRERLGRKVEPILHEFPKLTNIHLTCTALESAPGDLRLWILLLWKVGMQELPTAQELDEGGGKKQITESGHERTVESGRGYVVECDATHLTIHTLTPWEGHAGDPERGRNWIARVERAKVEEFANGT